MVLCYSYVPYKYSNNIQSVIRDRTVFHMGLMEYIIGMWYRYLDTKEYPEV